MPPIYVMYDSGVDKFEEEAILAALKSLLQIQGLDITCYGSESWSEGDYSSADWYIQHTNRIQGNFGEVQLDANQLLELIVNEPWQVDPHIDIMITSHDITTFDNGKQLNFVFGLAYQRATVQSIARFRSCPDSDRFIAIETVIWHELGHILGMAADLNRTNTEDNLGPHCTNPGCVMQQGLSVSEWVKHAREAKQAQQIYCQQCFDDVFVLVH